MTLYRLNLRLSQKLFSVISCFEVTLRNRISGHYSAIYGDDWLKDSACSRGMFDSNKCRITRALINEKIARLVTTGNHTHNKLMSEMDFGFWRHLFANPQFYAAGQTLLRIFPAKPRSSSIINYNHTYVFNILGQINNLRNRIAHHEPICFGPGTPIKDTAYARQHYEYILQLFRWMDIDPSALLFGLDHINQVCDLIDSL